MRPGVLQDAVSRGSPHIAGRRVTQRLGHYKGISGDDGFFESRNVLATPQG